MRLYFVGRVAGRYDADFFALRRRTALAAARRTTLEGSCSSWGRYFAERRRADLADGQGRQRLDALLALGVHVGHEILFEDRQDFRFAAAVTELAKLLGGRQADLRDRVVQHRDDARSWPLPCPGRPWRGCRSRGRRRRC